MQRGPGLLYKIGLAHQASFGKPLEESIRQNNGQVPIVIQMCCDVVEGCIETEGIYKVNVPPQKLEDYGNMVQDNSKLEAQDVHEVASLLKGYLNRLPAPLCPSPLYPQFVGAHAVPQADARFQRIKALFCSMPNANKMVLLHLLRHFYKVAQHAKANKMTVSSLAAMFAPVLFKPAKEADSLLRTMADQPALAAVLATLIAYHHLLLLSPEATPSILSAGTEPPAPHGRPAAPSGPAQSPRAASNGADPASPHPYAQAGPPKPHASMPPAPGQAPSSQAYPQFQPFFQHQQQPPQTGPSHPPPPHTDPGPSISPSARPLPLGGRLMVDVPEQLARVPHGPQAAPVTPPAGWAPWAPSASGLDPGLSQLLDQLIRETGTEELVIAPSFEVPLGGRAGWAEYQRRQAAQERRVVSAFGPSPLGRVRDLLAAPRPKPAPPEHPPPSPRGALHASEASSTDSSNDSDDYSAPAGPGMDFQTPQNARGAQDQQEGGPRKRPPGPSARLHEKQLTRELNAEIPVDLNHPYSCIQQRLARRRAKAQRPSSIHDMAVDQLRDEKRAIKMELKNFDSLFMSVYRRSPQKRDKEPLREVYAMYKAIKKAIDDQPRGGGPPDSHPSTSSSGGGASHPPGAAHPPDFPMHHTASTPTPATASTPGSGPSTDARTDPNWTPADIRRLKQEKRELKKRLCQFQTQFREEHGRDVVSRRDREPMGAEYERYRELKGLLRGLEGNPDSH